MCDFPKVIKPGSFHALSKGNIRDISTEVIDFQKAQSENREHSIFMAVKSLWWNLMDHETIYIGPGSGTS